MSYLRITTIHPDGYEKVIVAEHPGISAAKAFANRAKRFRLTGQGHLVDYTTRTIRLNPTETVGFTQYLEFADNYEDFPV